MKRIMLLATVALVMVAMLAMGASPVIADGNPGCGLYSQNEYATENSPESGPGFVGASVSGSAQEGGIGLGNAAGAKVCSDVNPSQ